MLLWSALVVLAALLLAGDDVHVQGKAVVKSSSKRKCGKVHITVSSLKEAYLELNWITDCDHPLDVEPAYIALYNGDPLTRQNLEPIDKIFASDYPDGSYKTTVKFQATVLPGNWVYSENLTKVDPGKRCFPYWVAAIDEDGNVIDRRCLAIQPTWLNDNRQQLLHKRMDCGVIPGTHNSGAYDSSRLATIVQNYVLNQDQIIWTQLVFGIRYLDLRIGYYKNDGFFINHDLIRITPLRPALQQIRKFLEVTDEIVLVDFHRFPYPTDFTPELHVMLLQMIYEELGQFVAFKSDYSGVAPFFFELWDMDRQVVISYAESEYCKEHDWLWCTINQFWANTANTAELKSYMLEKINSHTTGNSPFWALMAELTPQAIDILLMTNNLRKLADDVNREVTKWFRDEWYRLPVNIVATDFFLGNDIVNVAIDDITNNRCS